MRTTSPLIQPMNKPAAAMLLTYLFLALLVSTSSLSTQAQEPIESEENKVGGVEKVDPALEKKPDPTAVIPPKEHYPTAFSLIDEGNFYSPYAFLADKSTRTLSVWNLTPSGPRFVEAHPMDLGKNSGDKLVLGDRKTPEGIYFFERTHRSPHINFEEYGSLAFVMDYPNFFDKREKKTGSGIWLHAVPDTTSLFRGSRGCVVVRNQIIKELEKYITLDKTPIVVVDTAEFKPLKEYANHSKSWATWLNSWKNSWESKTLDGYIQHYHSDFKSLGMNKTAWSKFKSSLNEKYQFIKVQIQEPVVFVHADEAIVRFLQSYESDHNSDFGEKTLYLKKENGQFKIIGETWMSVSAERVAQKDNKINKSPASSN